MDRPDWVPEGVDLEQPSAARMYDYLLGGSHNFAVDRQVAQQGLSMMPDMAVHAQANRAFLYRAVRYLLDAGVRQFLDIGSGVPTVGNVHEIAQRVDPTARVVYVDLDPVAVAHSRAILTGNEYATIVQADLRQPSDLLRHPDLTALLDFGQPVGLLLVAILHAISDAHDPYRIVGELRDALTPGSYVAVSHLTTESLPELWETFLQLSSTNGYPLAPRGHPDVVRLFTGFDLIDPGVVWVPQWRPEDPDSVADRPERSSVYAGVGRKP